MPAPAAEIEPILARKGGDHHLVQFYEEEGFLVEVVARFLGDGLRKGEPCLVIAAPPHQDGFVRQLRSSGIDVETSLSSGHLVLLDARETLSRFMAQGMPEWTQFKSTIGPVIQQLHSVRSGSNVRAFGEMVDLLWRDGNCEAAIRLEEFWNDLGKLHSFSLLCAYVMGHFTTGGDAKGFQEVCRAHSHVIPSEHYTQLDSDDVRLRRISILEQRAQALEHEIENRKRIEKELLQALRVREDFLSVAGHELKTPLTAMQLQIDVLFALAARKEDADIAARVARLRKQAGRLGSLIDDLLDVSRLGAGRFKLDLQKVDLAEVVREVADRFRDTAERNRCLLRILAEDSIPGEWDRLRLEQVATNLLSNAFKFGAGKPVEVLAAGTRSRARLIVRDHGAGIPLKDQARIFHRFERAGAPMNHGGLGLGLWIARQIVEAHGGTIRVESAPDQGATFIVELPLS